jgi:hypothetical protein
VTFRGTSDFWKLYWGLPEEVRTAARAAYKKFQQNPAHPSLQLERMRADRAFGLSALRVITAPRRSDSQMTPGFGSAATEISIDSFPLNRELNALQVFNEPLIIRAAFNQ